MENLRGYDDIVIKQGDNRSAVVVMDREKCVDKAMPLKKDPTAEMIGDGYISDLTLLYLWIDSDARAGHFYFSLKYRRRIVQDSLLHLVVICLPNKYLHYTLVNYNIYELLEKSDRCLFYNLKRDDHPLKSLLPRYKDYTEKFRRKSSQAQH